MNAVVNLKDVVLETDRLVLREWKENDLNDFFEYASVDGVGQMAGWQPHKTIEESAFVLKMFIDEKKTFALELKENHKVIGSVGLEKLSTSVNDYYDSHTGREIGYVLNKDYWGQGLMTEAVKRVVNYCFENLRIDYLICSCRIDNIQSGRVMEKAGFRYFITKRRAVSDGSVRDALYHILDNPYVKNDFHYGWINDYLLSKKAVIKDFKAEWNWDRYMIDGKMFAAVCYDDDTSKAKYITVKLSPEDGEELRRIYADVIPGYYMNKIHWNSILADGAIPDSIVRKMLDKSYELILNSFSKKKQAELLSETSL